MPQTEISQPSSIKKGKLKFQKYIELMNAMTESDKMN